MAGFVEQITGVAQTLRRCRHRESARRTVRSICWSPSRIRVAVRSSMDLEFMSDEVWKGVGIERISLK
jgi:hypothetical protein